MDAIIVSKFTIQVLAQRFTTHVRHNFAWGVERPLSVAGYLAGVIHLLGQQGFEDTAQHLRVNGHLLVVRSGLVGGEIILAEMLI